MSPSGNYVSGDGRFASIERHGQFNQGLDLYCRQATRIVEAFSGGWFSKAILKAGYAGEGRELRLRGHEEAAFRACPRGTQPWRMSTSFSAEA